MTLTSRFEGALLYASVLHASQRRKGTNIPYFAHLISVAAIALEHGANEDEAIAALLHDSVEDAGGKNRLEDILGRYGSTVAEIVSGCTDSDATPKPPWRARKEAYIAHLKNASPSIRLVSAADKLHNSRSILMDYRTHGESVWTRFRGGGERDGTLWYYRALVDAFREFGSTPLLEELDRTVTELEKLARHSSA